MSRSIASLFVVCVLAAACNDPAPVSAHRSAVLIGDRGISIPLPPPSVLQAPQQEVEVHGALEGAFEEGAEVRLVDISGGDEASVSPDGVAFTAVLNLDLTDACVETWVVDADGVESERRSYSTRIEADDSILVEPGCD
ncbi:MAG: hypothetical protein ACRBN8_17110 [Nannocystales bacterium]